jgi:hypothetical protein
LQCRHRGARSPIRAGYQRDDNQQPHAIFSLLVKSQKALMSI